MTEAALTDEHDLPPLPAPVGPAGDFTAAQMHIYALADRAWRVSSHRADLDTLAAALDELEGEYLNRLAGTRYTAGAIDDMKPAREALKRLRGQAA
ncbi:hypothetical protein BH11PSE13_BH11PSE13_45090 [soil metagenome]